jgi:hypothetical protein
MCPYAQIFYHLGMAWDLRWTTSPCERIKYYPKKQKVFSQPGVHKQTGLRKKKFKIII